ncbi:hypothetical protein RND81_02G006200 [Saponaria officinalis]|uniref:CDT1 Geminin-binding domain-containing protein n=1 Tax=Saponaria officinalis TaxID=3572 RepID=A0AAW1MPA2_SAPOF
MESSSLIPFKSKKPLITTPVKNHHPATVGPTVSTPDPVQSRVRNRNFAMSVSDVRRAALQLREPGPETRSVSGRVGSGEKKSKGSGKSPALLPQKYGMLCEFFNAMVSSIRLLKMKRQPATLAKLSRNIESMTDRRFTMHHLAQLKYIVPDIIGVKKIRVQDEVTGCMKEELFVSLEVNALETEKIAKGSAGFSHLKGFFHSRIVDFATTHPESDDVPEGELPELFYKPKQEPEPVTSHTTILRPTMLTAPSFKRRFSSRALSSPVSEPSLAKPLPETPIKDANGCSGVTVDTDGTPAKVASTPLKFVSTPTKVVSTLSKFDSTPAKVASTPSKFDSTPAKYASTPARLMAATPALRTPKRSLVADDGAASLPNKPAKRRALRFEENNDDVEEQQPSHNCYDEIDVQVRNSVASSDLLDVLPENVLYSLMEKEQRTLEEQEPAVLQARKREQLMAGVPKLFDMIQLSFQSIRRSVMTKEELIQKLITGHLDIVDRGEVEDQLVLLQEIAPEFITEKCSLSGDILLRLNKSSCADSIRAKLLEAK